MSAVIMLFTLARGETIAVKFPTIEAARDWEDKQDDYCNGVARLVTPAEAHRLISGRE